MSLPIFSAKQYQGELSPEMASDLHNAAFEAGHDLLLSARMLMNGHRYGHASALAVLAIEEFGKTVIVMGIFLALPTGVAEQWKRYRKHESKTDHHNLAIKMAIRTTFPDISSDVAQSISEGGPTPRELNIYKQSVLYSDCYVYQDRSIKVYKPTDASNQELAQQLINEALVLANQTRPRSPQEMTLFLKHAHIARQMAVDFSSRLKDLEQDLLDAGIIQPGDWRTIISDLAT